MAKVDWKKEAEEWEEESDDWQRKYYESSGQCITEKYKFRWTPLIIGFIFGIMMGVAIIALSVNHISDQTLNDICINLTGDENAEGISLWQKELNGKIECVIPSYDSTNNIVIRNSGEGR